MSKEKSFFAKFWWLFLLVIALLVVTCVAMIWLKPWQSIGPAQPIAVDTSGSTSTTSTSSGGVTDMSETDSSQPLITLSEGQSQPSDSEVMPATSGTPLNEEEVQAILSRLPDMTAEETLQEDFNLPGGPIPPPKTGETIDQPFPPEETVEPAGTEDSGPLEVVRYSPEGEIPVAPFISITFNQPMVPLATLEQLNAMDIPVQVEPELEGTWRWLGTKTLTFQSDSDLYDRMPKSTEFKITIPAGTTSQTGGVLAEEVSFSFTTPPLALNRYYPTDDQQSEEPFIFVSFNQRINADALMPYLTLRADNKTYDLKLVSEDEYKENKTIQYYVDSSLEDRYMVLKPAKALDLDTYYSVVIKSGAPSAEGPLLTQNDLSFGFSTYAPLKIDDYGCSWSDSPCQPFSPLFIRFNNSLDMSAYEEGWLTIEPAIENVNANIYGNSISIQGSTAAQTTYTIVVSKDVQDIFGQTLGKNQTLKFRIGKATPTLVGPSENFITVDPSTKNPALSVYAMNYSKLDVEIYRVQPTDWLDYMTYLEEYRYTDTPPDVPGDRIFNKSVPVEGSANALHQVNIDLSPYMDGSSGQFIVIVKPPSTFFAENEWQTIQTWVQVTQIGLDAFVDHSEMVAWATNLKDGSPLANVTIASDKAGTIGTTDQDGLLNFNIPNSARYLTATSGADYAMLPNSTSPWDDGGWQTRTTSDYLRWYIFDDRTMYKPGEEIHIKGWIRKIGGKQGSDVNLIGLGVTQVNYSILGPQGNELGTGSVDVNSFGGFDFVYTIPEEVNLGYASIEFVANGPTYANSYHEFQIQEFRRPEFEVTARNESSGPYFAGDEATVAVDANYYAGGALPNAETTWNVSSSPTTYTPPNWSDFTFGSWTPWWFYGYYESYDSFDSGSYYETFTGTTDAAGTHYLDLAFSPDLNARPLSVTAEATVMDVNRQAWTSSTNLLVHPANLYVGMRTDRYFVKKGQPLDVEFIVTDIVGNPVTDRVVEIEAARLEWKTSGSGWHQEAVDVQTCKTGSTEEPGLCTFETPVGGSYRITATITDEMGRTNQSSMTRWVSGGNRPSANKVEQEQITLIPDKDNYEDGDIAEILVQSPFGAANGVMTVARNGILYSEPFEMTEDTIVLQVPIEEGYVPNVNVQIDLVGSAVRTDANGNEIKEVEPRPAYGTGTISLTVPPTKRELSVEAIPQEAEMEPGGNTKVDIKVVDASGEPVANSEVALVVVDESILALTNYQVSDPMSVFYTNHFADLSVYYSRSHIMLVDVQNLVAENQEKSVNARDGIGGILGMAPMAEEESVMMEMAEAPAMEMAMDTVSSADGEGAATQAITIRSDFNPLANFSPTVTTNARGEATVSVKLPDNLTRYRVIAIAVDDSGKKFGTSEASITARLPLMVRPSAPRFLNFGDEFELPVVLQNQTDEDLGVQVALRAANLSLTDYAGLQVTIPANDRIEVRFPSKADMAGTASFQVAAVSGRFSDAATIDLPVYTPATTEAFATYGTIDSGSIVQPLASPEDVFPQYGGLEITTSSTALQALTDAVMYLVNYPYLCSEQVASRILGIAALRDVLTAFEADGLPSPEEMEASVDTGITRLQGMQNWDGGFPVWRRGYPSSPFNTIHVAHALQRAEDKGFDVPQDMQQNVLTYLTDIESHYPGWYSDYTRRNLSSYAVYVRALMGDVDGYKAQSLIDQYGLENFNLSSVGWLYQVFLQADGYTETLNEIRTLIANRVVETPSAANFTTEYNEQAYLLLESDRRTDAILLDAMIMDNPNSDLIPKVVNGLLAHRTRGRWSNTQENVFVLLALDNYFNTYESETPDFVARMWLGETYAGSHTYEGYSTDQQETMIPMRYLMEGEDLQDLIISKEGTGRLYYRMGLSYAPTDLQMDPLDMGFVVDRVYEAVNDPDDVYLDNDGVWHIKAGAEVRVRITLTADNRRYHVAMADPLPAGLEIVNPELAVSSADSETQADPSYRSYWWWGPWYEHQNLRDERAEAFTSLLWDGTYQYSYLTRATTPGRFVAPPTKVEEMYTPEVFGRSASDIVIVE